MDKVFSGNDSILRETSVFDLKLRTATPKTWKDTEIPKIESFWAKSCMSDSREVKNPQTSVRWCLIC